MQGYRGFKELILYFANELTECKLHPSISSVTVMFCTLTLKAFRRLNSAGAFKRTASSRLMLSILFALTCTEKKQYQKTKTSLKVPHP